jgi:hypothetical protein
MVKHREDRVASWRPRAGSRPSALASTTFLLLLSSSAHPIICDSLKLDCRAFEKTFQVDDKNRRCGAKRHRGV